MALDALGLIDGNGKLFDAGSMPRALITGTGAEPKPRLRVDVAQTSFFEGREFRAYKELSIAAGATLVGKFVSPVDFILFHQALVLTAGAIRMSTYIGGTPGGTFTSIPVIGKNRMSDRPLPLYAAQVLLSSGGTSTGGTEVDLQIVSAIANGQNAISVGAAADDARGLPAGEYHIRFLNTSSETAIGVYSLAWEERAPSSTIIT